MSPRRSDELVSAPAASTAFRTEEQIGAACLQLKEAAVAMRCFPDKIIMFCTIIAGMQRFIFHRSIVMKTFIAALAVTVMLAIQSAGSRLYCSIYLAIWPRVSAEARPREAIQ